MGAYSKRRNYWRERFATGGSFAEQASLLSQDFGLVSLLLLSTDGLHWLLRISDWHPLFKSTIEWFLLGIALTVVAMFGAELVMLCFNVVRKAIARESASTRRVLKTVPGKPKDGFSPAGLDMHPSSGLNAFRTENAVQAEQLQKEIESGQFNRDVAEMPRAFEILGDGHERFDAVSCCELSFWHTGGDPFAEEYFNRCSALVREGKIATRVFLVSREEFEQGADLLRRVFIKHLRAGIGIAVVPYAELPSRLRDLELDFALWNLGDAFSRFRQHGDWNRKLYVEYSMGGQNQGVADKVQLYRQLLGYVWLADRTFLDAHSELIAEMRDELQRNTSHIERRIGAKTPADGIFYLEVRDNNTLFEAVDKLFDLRKWIDDTAVEEPSLPVNVGFKERSTGSQSG